MTAKGVFNFNSIKVRLEHYDAGGDKKAPSFQFHKGTIRTEELSPLLAEFVKFQFHKGTIRTSQGRCHRASLHISIP